MYLICRENVENIFKYLNKRTQATFNKHNLTIHNEKDLHDIK